MRSDDYDEDRDAQRHAALARMRELEPDRTRGSVMAIAISIVLTVGVWGLLGSILALGTLIVCAVACWVLRPVGTGGRVVVSALAMLLFLAVFFGTVATLPTVPGVGHG